MIINDLDGYYIVFDTKNWNTELDTLYNNLKNEALWQRMKIKYWMNWDEEARFMKILLLKSEALLAGW